jgi:hypothetical protein
MKIVSCGSSFFSLDKYQPKTHLSELMAQELGAELVSLAKPGSSNFAIRLQLDTAIKMKPDLILFEFTNAQKVDLPLSVLGEDYRYDARNGADNLRYTNYDNIVPSVIDHAKASVLSDGIKNFIDGQCFRENTALTKTSRQALQYWFTELYDEQIKYHQDYYICSSVFSALDNSKIPYVWCRGDLCMFDWSLYNNEVGEEGNPWIGWTDPGQLSVYHTTPQKQQELFAHWLETYRKNWL